MVERDDRRIGDQRNTFRSSVGVHADGMIWPSNEIVPAFFGANQQRVIVGLFDQLKSILGKNAPISAPDMVADQAIATGVQPPDRRVRERHDARPGTSALIVDDSPTIVAALRKMLNSAGYVTLEALSAEEGIEIARDLTPDLIFLDIVLPGMNGFAALRTLRRDPLTRDIPVIMISGNEQATEQFFGTRIGADDFMKKPFSRLEVFARIERLLDADMVPRRTGGATAVAAAASGGQPAGEAKV